MGGSRGGDLDATILELEEAIERARHAQGRRRQHWWKVEVIVARLHDYARGTNPESGPNITWTLPWRGRRSGPDPLLVERLRAITELVASGRAEASQRDEELRRLSELVRAEAFARDQKAERRPARKRVVAAAVIGCALPLIGGTLLARSQLDTQAPPHDVPPEIGFSPVIAGSVSQGFEANVTVKVSNCRNPVSVDVVLTGSAEYWARSERAISGGAPAPGGMLGHALPIAVAVAGPNPMGLRLQVPANVSGRVYDVADVRREEIRAPKAAFGSSAIYLLAGSMNRWDYSHAAVNVTFSANWLEPRGPGSCYLRTPALISPSTDCATGAAEQATPALPPVQPSVDEWLHMCAGDNQTESVSFGSTVVDAKGDSVDAANSLPAPTDPSFSRWTCAATSPTPMPAFLAPTKYHSPPTVLFGMAGLRRADDGAPTCASIVVLSSPSAATSSQLWLLLGGALIAVGAATAFELLRRLLMRGE